MSEPSTRIEALIGEIQQDARELREKHGGSTVPSLEPIAAAVREGSLREEASTAGGLSAPTLAELRRHLRPAAVEFTSHRGLVGRVIVFVKKLLTQLLAPVLERQTIFNQTNLDALEQLEKAVLSLRQEKHPRIDSLEERITTLERSTGVETTEASTHDFDYAAFEEAFRGDSEHVAAVQRRYLEYFPDAAAGPVLDLGCGRGEFLAMLGERDIPSWGLDVEHDAVLAAREKGLDVRERDLILGLRDCAAGSLGGIVSFQVFEHLTLGKLTRVLELAHTKLRPGGVLIAETVNVASLITHARAFTLDPTHQLALHPLTLKLLVEGCGFHDVDVVFSGEVEDDLRMETAGMDEAMKRNLERLNHIVFAPQDYAVIARA